MDTIKGATLVRVNKDFEMPSLPVAPMRILRFIDDNQASARRLEELILQDPSLSARLLKLANSAFYPFRREVKTISQATVLLGLSLVKSLAIGVSIMEAFARELRNEIPYITLLWMHSFAAGLVAQEIQARRTRRADAESALLCGLLHDLGEVVFFQQDPGGYSQIFAVDKGGTDLDICAFETEHYGLNHATMGSMLVKHWGLPPELATVARYHHDVRESNSPLVMVVALADNLVKRAGIGYDGDNRPSPDLPGIREQLQMGTEEWERLCAFACDNKEHVEELFKRTS